MPGMWPRLCKGGWEVMRFRFFVWERVTVHSLPLQGRP